MKSIKTNLISLTLIILVVSTISFKPKCCSYCVSLTQDNGCGVVSNKTEINNGNPGATYYKYNEWDGNVANCQATRCPTPIILYNEN